jgi:peptidoglycan hydrolase-like protein with peptidoglycan-binding domain
MTDTLFADVSSFQDDVNDEYPYAFLSFRSNDGDYRDPHFQANLKWAKEAVASGKLKGFAVYFVWETNWLTTFETFKDQVGDPHPQMAVMIDVESWGGRIEGNHSAEINDTRNSIVAWLDSERNALQKAWDKINGRSSLKRVWVYANAGDFANLYPYRKSVPVVLANYSSNPTFLGKIAHQFSDHYPCKPFGYSDMNSADGYDSVEFQKKVGLYYNKISPKPPVVARKPKAPEWPLKKGDYFGSINGDIHSHGGNPHFDSPALIADIKKIQSLLVKHGFAGKVDAAKWVDGIYGTATFNAVKELQKKNGTRKPSGNIGPVTWKLLFTKYS